LGQEVRDLNGAVTQARQTAFQKEALTVSSNRFAGNPADADTFPAILTNHLYPASQKRELAQLQSQLRSPGEARRPPSGHG